MKRYYSKVLQEEVIILDRHVQTKPQLGPVVYTYIEAQIIKPLSANAKKLLHFFKREFNGTVIKENQAYQRP